MMKQLLKKIVFLHIAAKKAQSLWRLYWGSKRLKTFIQKEISPLKIVIGSSGVFETGWIPTDVEYLNLLNKKDWEKYFKKNSIDAILAEHVWEHLTLEDGLLAARNCYKHLNRGGYLRVAVPDGFHPDPEYIKWVDVAGVGPGADDHKVLYNYKTFCSVFENAGFTVNLLEYYDENGEFHAIDWDADAGKIHRSKKFDNRNKDGILKYTSIILDAYKNT